MSKPRPPRQHPSASRSEGAPAQQPPSAAPAVAPELPTPPSPDACAVVRFAGRGAFGGRPEHTIGDTPIRAPLMRTACVSIPQRDIADALRKGFEFVRWARGSVVA